MSIVSEAYINNSIRRKDSMPGEVVDELRVGSSRAPPRHVEREIKGSR